MEGIQTREVRGRKSLETGPQEHFMSPESPAVRTGKVLKGHTFIPQRVEGKLRPRRVGHAQVTRRWYGAHVSQGIAKGFAVRVRVVIELCGWPSHSGMMLLAPQASPRE